MRISRAYLDWSALPTHLHAVSLYARVFCCASGQLSVVQQAVKASSAAVRGELASRLDQSVDALESRLSATESNARHLLDSTKVRVLQSMAHRLERGFLRLHSTESLGTIGWIEHVEFCAAAGTGVVLCCGAGGCVRVV